MVTQDKKGILRYGVRIFNVGGAVGFFRQIRLVQQGVVHIYVAVVGDDDAVPGAADDALDQDAVVVVEGDDELVMKIDSEGYDWLYEELKIQPVKENKPLIYSLGTCARNKGAK